MCLRVCVYIVILCVFSAATATPAWQNVWKRFVKTHRKLSLGFGWVFNHLNMHLFPSILNSYVCMVHTARPSNRLYWLFMSLVIFHFDSDRYVSVAGDDCDAYGMGISTHRRASHWQCFSHSLSSNWSPKSICIHHNNRHFINKFYRTRAHTRTLSNHLYAWYMLITNYNCCCPPFLPLAALPCFRLRFCILVIPFYTIENTCTTCSSLFFSSASAVY